ncbi:MAG: phosphoadenosine phosphosulfate reductase [Phormidesmis sp.]
MTGIPIGIVVINEVGLGRIRYIHLVQACQNIMVKCIEAPDTFVGSFDSASASTHASTSSLALLRQFLAQLDLDQLNQQFAEATPQEILAWCVRYIPQGLVQTTSFSLLTLTHMLYSELAHPVPVIFLDTLHLFPETLETAQKAKAAYDLDLHTYRVLGADSPEAFASRYGERLWAEDVERFYALTKIEPLQRGLEELGAVAWITGRRRDQSDVRKNLPIFERDDQGRLKINPLATWTNKDIWSYVFAQGVLYNPLHDQGYTSIGDQPLTTPTAAGEDERAGRWRGSEKTECGIHW